MNNFAVSYKNFEKGKIEKIWLSVRETVCLFFFLFQEFCEYNFLNILQIHGYFIVFRQFEKKIIA